MPCSDRRSSCCRNRCKEGFGLTVTEALWKGKPVIGGACGGITLQVHDYQTGFLVHSPAGAAYRIRYLLRYAEKRQRMGQTGHEFVREHFLLTRHLRDYLTMLLCLDHPGGGHDRGVGCISTDGEKCRQCRLAVGWSTAPSLRGAVIHPTRPDPSGWIRPARS